MSKSNYILSKLPEKEYERISNYLELVKLFQGKTLVEAEHKVESLYFPTKGVVSLTSEMEDGSVTEVGIIGNEGVVGTHPFIGDGVAHHHTTVQIKGEALRIDANVLRKEFRQTNLLQKLLPRYALKLFNQVSQFTACNKHHNAKQRTATRLLMLDDRLDKNKIFLTQKFISRLLGIRRTGVSEVTSKFQQQGIIECYQGEIEILNREALEEIACECYQFFEL